MRQIQRFIPFGAALALVVIAGVEGAVTATPTAGTSFTTAHVGGISGPVGYLSGTSSGSTASSTYGHNVTGATCTGSDAPTQSNMLEVKLVWDGLTPAPTTISASVQMRDKAWNETSTDNHCPQGPPSFIGSSVITLTDAAVGTGGGSNTAGSSAHNLSVRGGPGTGANDPTIIMSPSAWAPDPSDSTTWTKYVTAKVTVAFNGTAVEIKDVVNTNSALCKLTAAAN